MIALVFRRLWISGCLLGIAGGAAAQTPGLSADDRARIQDLSARYLQTLGACEADAYASLFVPESGYFASGFRGVFAGREQLAALVRSERHCAGETPAARPGGGNVPTVEIEATTAGVHGLVRLGTAEYQDEYVQTPDGWRFASRTVVIAGEAAAGLDAEAMLEINRLGGPDLAEYYETDPGGSRRLMTVGTRISVVDGEVRGRVYLDDGSYRDEVYEQTAAGGWRVKTGRDAAR